MKTKLIYAILALELLGLAIIYNVSSPNPIKEKTMNAQSHKAIEVAQPDPCPTSAYE